MTRQVVFGTGQVGGVLVEQLVEAGHDVVGVNRSGRGTTPGATSVGGDASDPRFTRAVCAGADVVYFCLNAARYDRWSDEFPPLQRAVLAGAADAGARLVVLDNLYAYGPTGGRPLRESSAVRPTSAKAATRAAMTTELLAAHASGQVEIAIGRASDYVGPGVTQSALGEAAFTAVLRGRTVQVMGDPDQPHSYAYAPDVATGLRVLGEAPAATGRVWHLPVDAARTTRQVIEEIGRAAGRPVRILAAGPTVLRLAGLVKPGLRELRHTLYQFSEPWVVDDGAFRRAFGVAATPLDEALATTVAWFRSRLEQQAHPSTPHATTTTTTTTTRSR